MSVHDAVTHKGHHLYGAMKRRDVKRYAARKARREARKAVAE